MGRQEGKAIGPVRLEKRLVLHSLCQLASWAFVAVLITVLPRVGGENSPGGTVSSGTFHQEGNNCLSPQLGRDSQQAAPGGRQPTERAVRPHRRRGSDRGLPGALAEGASRASTARGCPAGRGQGGAGRLASPERTPGAGERAHFSSSAFKLSELRRAPGDLRRVREAARFIFGRTPAGWALLVQKESGTKVRECNRVGSGCPCRQNDPAPNPVSGSH